MKSRSLITVLFTIIFSIASWAGVNRTLEEAQSLFTKAKTAAQYEAAKKKYRSAAYDPGYNSTEHDMSINEGIRKCDIAIERLTPRLTLNDQNYLNLSLKAEGGREYVNVKTNASSWDASGVPSWCSITEKSRTSFCISYEANPNNYTRTGSMTIYTDNGKEVHIDMSQRAGSQSSSLVVTKAEFYNFDKDGNNLCDYGATLYSDDMRYLGCRIYYSGIQSTTSKTIYVKIFRPDDSMCKGTDSPSGYTRKREVTLYSGQNNIVDVGGWGNATSTTYEAGTYRYEIWIDGKKVYTAYPYITSSSSNYSSNGITITKAKFANTDYNSNIITDYGETLRSNDMRYLSCKIYYNGGSSDVTKTLYIKIFKPDGTLSSGNSSPDGFTRKREVTFHSGSNNVADLGGWGNSDESIYSSGTYTYEFWIDGKKVYTAYPYISSGGSNYSNSLNITSAEFCNQDYDGNMLDDYGSTLYSSKMRYLKCKFYYNGLTSTTSKNIYVKIYDPNGTLKTGSQSPDGYTFKYDDRNLYSGSNSLELLGYGNNTKSTYSAGTYRYEIWIDEKLEYTAYVTIKSAQTAEIDNVWVDWDVYEDGYKGMRIHVKCDISGAKGHECQVALYFYDEYENALTDYDDSYDTTDGKVATHVTVTPKYDNTSFSDIKIFMPYNQLHVNTYGVKKDFKYKVEIYDTNTESYIGSTGFYDFNFTN